MRLCKRCILPESFPGIKFDDRGICNFCLREEKSDQKLGDKKIEYQLKLDGLISEVRGKAPVYDAVVAYSGGKDSTYALKILRERYDLRLAAFTFDNHFISPGAWKNIETITSILGVDLVTFRPAWPVMKALFRKTAREDIFPLPTLLRASSICTACIGIVKSMILKMSLESAIPLIGFGWSPGQAPIQSAILKTNPDLVKKNQSVMKQALKQELGPKVMQYFIPDGYYEKYKGAFPYNIHPLAFFDYDEGRILDELGGLGWKAPSDTDSNSTNCLLNAFANASHLERHHFHPYVWEIANMVRKGIMGREEGIAKIYTEQDARLVEDARNRLGL